VKAALHKLAADVEAGHARERAPVHEHRGLQRERAHVDFGSELTPELRAREERLREAIAHQRKA
jgi:hypothetical protein